MFEAPFMRPHCFPTESAVSLCLFSLVLSFFVSHVIQWSSVTESVLSVLTSSCLHVPIRLFVFQGFVFWFFFAGAGSAVVHICALRQCGALRFPAPPQLLIFFFLLVFILLYSIIPLTTTALVPLYCPCFVYFIEDVWLNILRLAESRDVLVSVDHYARGKPSLVLNTFKWGPWISLFSSCWSFFF